MIEQNEPCLQQLFADKPPKSPARHFLFTKKQPGPIYLQVLVLQVEI
jgi:hypothetical protein